MNQVDINFKPVLEQISHKFNNLTELKENKRNLKLSKKRNMMGGFIDLATFDDLQKNEDVLDTIEAVVETIEETVAEIIVAAEPIIMTVIEPMIVAEVISMVAPILVLAPILAPVDVTILPV